MEKIYLSSEEYDVAVAAYRKQHGYDDMSEEEQTVFDERLNKVVGKKEDSFDASEDVEATDSSDGVESVNDRSDADKLRDDLKSQYGYDEMPDDQKRAFDERLDEVIGQDSSEDEDPDQPEKVLKLTRSR